MDILFQNLVKERQISKKLLIIIFLEWFLHSFLFPFFAKKEMDILNFSLNLKQPKTMGNLRHMIL